MHSVIETYAYASFRVIMMQAPLNVSNTFANVRVPARPIAAPPLFALPVTMLSASVVVMTPVGSGPSP